MKNQIPEFMKFRLFGFHTPIAMSSIVSLILLVVLVTIWNYTQINLQILLSLILLYISAWLSWKQYHIRMISELLYAEKEYKSIKDNVSKLNDEKQRLEWDIKYLDSDIKAILDAEKLKAQGFDFEFRVNGSQTEVKCIKIEQKK